MAKYTSNIFVMFSTLCKINSRYNVHITIIICPYFSRINMIQVEIKNSPSNHSRKPFSSLKKFLMISIKPYQTVWFLDMIFAVRNCSFYFLLSSLTIFPNKSFVLPMNFINLLYYYKVLLY